MRSTPFRFCALATVFSLSLVFTATAQQKAEKKYPSLLWEITGNGLTKPSYLFGTMHVSSKMVFHLSDSFYVDIKNSDVVALELDPQLWQDQLFRFENMESNLRFFTQGSPNDFINEKSFQLERYDERLKTALSDEPTVINGLLYRTFRTRADFEEDTYLDLYIYQTGRKLGKQATGVENYFQTERLVMEATQDMMQDRKKHSPELDGESAYDLERKTQEAYRQGDLDMLDSLEKLMEPSQAYMEKFLYRRNEIQAASIDSIVRKHSLFVGVGAAHLPGRRGVIELLRKKGYTLRPVMMPDRDATRRDDIDKIKVPVTFSTYTSEDGDFSVSVPGTLHRRPGTRMISDSWQYADMSNGAYYLVGRVNTHSCFLWEKDGDILKKIDSLLYENIPGKILKKSEITRSGYKGYDVSSRTRRGDLQRYNILVTPFEIWVFKMSGTNNYVDGPEAEQFFSSIRIRSDPPGGWTDFSPAWGGFTIRLPRQPRQEEDRSSSDEMPRWEYEATDSASGDSYLIWKKTVQNYRFLEEDTADLALMEESFRLSDRISRPVSRGTGVYRDRACLDAVYQTKDGAWIRARFLVHGPDEYVLAARGRNKDRNFTNFFNSFAYAPYRHTGYRNYTDSFLHVTVATPVVPDVDAGMRRILERATSEDFLSSLPDYNGYWPHPRTALFEDDSTGEAVFVSVESFPKYYYPRDSGSFWTDETNEKHLREDMIVSPWQPLRISPQTTGYQYTISDTNSSRHIRTWIFLNDNRLFRVLSLTDSSDTSSAFTRRFYSSIRPTGLAAGSPVFASKLDTFFDDFYSADSATAQRARDAIPNVYFGPAGVPLLLRAIAMLPYNGKDYFQTKTKLINELGYINDSVSINNVVEGLRHIYERAGDTSTIQNAVFKALAHLKTRPAYELLKRLMVQDPPIFDNSQDYNYLFEDFGDSLALARILFPDLLRLASVEDYKSSVQNLLADLVDSGFIRGAEYESYLSQIWFDARIQWKKQEARDEKRLQKKEDDNDENASDGADVNPGNDLDNFAILLAPFYDKNPNIPRFFDRMLTSPDGSLRLKTAILLLRHDHPVADSVIRNLAASDIYRSDLYRELSAINRTYLFPKQYLNQLDMARSLLAAGRGNAGLAAVQFVAKRKIQFKESGGFVYFFKYKPGLDDAWQIGISGIQPADPAVVNTATEFVELTGKKLMAGEPFNTQFDDQLRHLMFSKRKSAASFYIDHNFYDRSVDED